MLALVLLIVYNSFFSAEKIGTLKGKLKIVFKYLQQQLIAVILLFLLL